MSFCRHLTQCMGGTAGPSAIHYFEEAFPEVTPFGSKGLYHNKAEWIVDLTTKARAGGMSGSRASCQGQHHSWTHIRAGSAAASCTIMSCEGRAALNNHMGKPCCLQAPYLQ